MADDSLEAHLQRLAAIVAPLAETVNQHDARMAHLEALVASLADTAHQHDARMAVLEAIVARLDRLIAEVFRERHNGRGG